MCGTFRRYQRTGFVTEWLADTSTRRTVVRKDLRGFATIRECRGGGCKIAPIVAPDLGSALDLIAAALLQITTDVVHIDVAPGVCSLAEALGDCGFSETYATARMYRGVPPHQAPSLFAIGSMELG